MAAGVGLVVLSALGYSLLGCLYEWLSAVKGPAMSHAKVRGRGARGRGGVREQGRDAGLTRHVSKCKVRTTHFTLSQRLSSLISSQFAAVLLPMSVSFQVATTTSLIGLVATSVFQLLYTRPRWQEMVLDRMSARGLTWRPVMRLYTLFGGTRAPACLRTRHAKDLQGLGSKSMCRCFFKPRATNRRPTPVLRSMTFTARPLAFLPACVPSLVHGARAGPGCGAAAQRRHRRGHRERLQVRDQTRL